jgi:hypothetical protein
MTLRTIITTALLLLTSTQNVARPGTPASMNKKIMAVLNEGLSPAEQADSLVSYTKKIIDLSQKIDPDHSCHNNLFTVAHLEQEETNAILTAARIKKASDLVLYDEAFEHACHLRFHRDRAKLLVEKQAPRKAGNFLARLISKL